MKKLSEIWLKRKTKGFTKIPLFTMVFNYKMWEQDKNSKNCTFYAIHPDLRDDKFVEENLKKVVDYIRDNYDMEKLTKI